MDKSFMEKPACQNIDVHFFQTRNPLEWKARLEVGDQTFVVGPANIATILNNVANLVRTEAAYADLQVHGPDEIKKAMEPTPQQKAAQAGRRERAKKELAAKEEAAKSPMDHGFWIEASEEAYGRDKPSEQHQPKPE